MANAGSQPSPSTDRITETHGQDALELVKIEKKSGVLWLILNNPASRNALSRRMIASISSALDGAEKDKDLKAIVISHEGPVFSSGHDLKEMNAARNEQDGGLALYTAIMGECAQMMQKIVNHPLPVIAKVKGTATAAGCQMVASCDLAYATKEVRFATPGVNIGLFCSTPMVALSRNVSSKHAMEMLLTGEMVSAERAAATGLINEALDSESLDSRVEEVAALIASKARSTLKTGKQAFYRQKEMPLEQAYDYAAKVMVENMMRDDAKEGISAFLQKRPANWPTDLE